MIVTLIVLAILLALPFLIKVGLLYFAYIQWALATPIITRVLLFRRSNEGSRPRKQPIGFFKATEGDPEPVPVSRKK